LGRGRARRLVCRANMQVVVENKLDIDMIEQTCSDSARLVGFQS
jgi:hypothetical protein